MSVASLDRTIPARERSAFKLGPGLAALLICAPIALALSWHTAASVWQTGAFNDTDDATRMVQIRDWMAGQAWFDLSAHRMGLPQGLVSHWSRVVDVPVAALVRLFGLGLPPDEAERAARIAWPLALQAAMIGAMGYAARVLAGPSAVVPAGLLIVLAGIGCSQFEPGRVHHHSPQIVLLTLMAGAVIEALDPARARRATLAAAALALSLAIGLENLPFVAVILAVPPLAWALGGDAHRPALLWFSGGLALAVPALFLLTVGPSRYGITSVDAFSAMHVFGLLAGAGLMAFAAAMGSRLPTRASRLAALLAAAAVLGAALWILFAAGLHGPFFGMDPLLRPFWLDEVEEVRPLLRLVREEPDLVLVLMAPMAAGTALAVAAAREARGLARARWLVLLALVAVGLAGSVWAIRVASSLQPLALLGGASAVGTAWDRARRDGRALALWRPALPLALCSSLAWTFVPWPSSGPARAGDGCLAPAALAPLSALPPGVAFAPIDLGPFLLAHTGLSVLAGPYHRDNAGLHAVIAGFLADPGAARALVEATGARYVMDCGGHAGLERRAAPGGLAAALAAGRVPDWLEPLSLGATPIRVYAVR